MEKRKDVGWRVGDKPTGTEVAVSRSLEILRRFVGSWDFLGKGERETASGVPIDYHSPLA